MPRAASIDIEEVARFSEHAPDWWNPAGALKPLHKLNPSRMAYIRDTVCARFKREGAAQAFKGLAVLDIGCGGGLVSEPLARLGATVTAIDASQEAITAAKAHAKKGRLSIDYRAISAEELAQSGARFDVITAMEIVEHVADIGSLLRSAQKMLKPKGVIILSTVNRTVKSYLLGIVAAEYILRWVPAGTHEWRKFLKPSELIGHLAQVGLSPMDVTGVIYNPLSDTFHLRHGAADVNYLLTAEKA